MRQTDRQTDRQTGPKAIKHKLCYG